MKSILILSYLWPHEMSKCGFHIFVVFLTARDLSVLKISTFGDWDSGSRSTCHTSMGSAPQEPRKALPSGVYMQCQLSPSARLGTDTGEAPKACRPASLTTTATNSKRCSFKHGGLRGPTPSWPWCSTPEAEASLVFRVSSKAAKGIKTVPSWGGGKEEEERRKPNTTIMNQ